MAVTGPNTDVWLVKTVAALLIPVTITLFVHTLIDTDRLPALVPGAPNACAFTIVDAYCVTADVIPHVYLADAVVETGFPGLDILHSGCHWREQIRHARQGVLKNHRETASVR